jgi:hypothetical protein
MIIGILFFLLFFLFVFGIGILGTIFWIWMLVDCIQNRGLQESTKIIWILVIVFTHFIGALIYFFAGRPARNQAFYPPPMPGQAPYGTHQQPPPQYQQPPQSQQQVWPNQQAAQQPPQGYQQQGATQYQQGYQGQHGMSYPGQGSQPASASEQYQRPQASYPEQQSQE